MTITQFVLVAFVVRFECASGLPRRLALKILASRLLIIYSSAKQDFCQRARMWTCSRAAWKRRQGDFI